MYQTEQIAGYDVNMIVSKDGSKIRSATILVGDDKPGWRSKDHGSSALRRAAKLAVLDALSGDPRASELAAKRVKVQAVYSELSVAPNGTIERRDTTGQVIAVYGGR